MIKSISPDICLNADYLMIGTWMVWKFLDDFKVPNINMVHVNTLQVDITTEEVKYDDTAYEAGNYQK